MGCKLCASHCTVKWAPSDRDAKCIRRTPLLVNRPTTTQMMGSINCCGGLTYKCRHLHSTKHRTHQLDFSFFTFVFKKRLRLPHSYRARPQKPRGLAIFSTGCLGYTPSKTHDSASVHILSRIRENATNLGFPLEKGKEAALLDYQRFGVSLPR